MPNADGSVIIKTSLDVNKAEKELAKLKASVAKTETEIEQMGKQRSPLIKQLEELGLQADEAARRLEEMKNAPIGTYSNSQIKEQAETVRTLGDRFDATAQQVSSYSKKIDRATSKLRDQKEQAGMLEKSLQRVNRASIKMAEARERSEKSMALFGSRLKSVVRSALVFTLVTKALAEVRKWVSGLIATNEEARESVAKLKAALLTMAQPLVNVVIPAFTKVVDVLTSAVIVVGRLFAAIAGTTYEDAKDAADALNKEQEAITGVGNAAKKAERQLASFDEINKLSDSTDSKYIAPNFEALDFSKLPEWLQNLTLELEAKIESLKFKYDRSNIVGNSDDFNNVLDSILGAVIGGIFGGFKGSAIGLAVGAVVDLLKFIFQDKVGDTAAAKEQFDTVVNTIFGFIIGLSFGGFKGGVLGLAISLLASVVDIDFKDAVQNLAKSKESFLSVMKTILLAVVGGAFFGIKGASVGLALGIAADVIGIDFFDRFENQENAKTMFDSVITSILGAVLGAKFGGLTGAGIGLLLGLLVSLVGIEFKKGEEGNWSNDNTLIVVLSSILFGILGGIFGGIKGAAIGLLLGAVISFAAIEFSEEGSWNKKEAITGLRTAITTVLGAVLGAVAFKFLGVSGGIIGALFGLTIGFASVAFDPEMDPVLAKKAKSNFLASMTALFGAIIGTALLGPVGTIAGGAIGLTVGLFINFVIEGWDFVKENVPNFTGIGPDYSWMFKDTTVSTPSVASGFVVPRTSAYTPSYISDPSGFFGTDGYSPSGVGGGVQAGSTTIILELNNREFARAVYDANSAESGRIGVSLVK